MGHRKGKATALSVTALGIMTLLTLAVVMKDRIAEEWFIHKLQSNSEAETASAARNLGVLGSVRSVPGLAKLALWSAEYESLIYLDPELSLISVEGSESASFWARDEVLQALNRIGVKAIPSLLHELSSSSFETRLGAAFALGELGGEAKAAIPLLELRCKDSQKEMRVVAQDAMKKILR
jgi:HEAT repeat protein